MQKNNPLLSIVIPVYQASNLIDELIQRLIKNLSPITENFEIILVDDGSLDASWEKIAENCANNLRVKGQKLSRNFGQHRAITTGLDAASGQWIVVMDCDLQDRPEEIPNLFQKAQEGYDMVLASRLNRKDTFRKRIISKLFYRFLSFLSGTNYDCTIANFGIYHKKVIDSVLQMRESIRYFPAMVNWVGFKKVSIPVTHAERPRGKTTYNFKKQVKLALDILLAYSDRPLRLIVGLGATISLSAFLYAFVILYKALKGQIAVLGYTSLIVAISFFSGVIISVLRILGLYIGKIFEGIKKRPIYIISEKINEDSL